MASQVWGKGGRKRVALDERYTAMGNLLLDRLVQGKGIHNAALDARIALSISDRGVRLLMYSCFVSDEHRYPIAVFTIPIRI